MEKLSQEEIEIREHEFFNNEITLSFSGTSKLIQSPKDFYKEYVLKIKEPTIAKNLIKGSLTHYLVLEKDINMSNDFILLPGKLPSEAVQNIIYTVYEQYLQDIMEFNEDTNKIEDPTYRGLSAYSKMIFDLLTEYNLFQNIGAQKDTPEQIFEKRINKVITEDAVDYFDFLKNSKGKTLIDSKTFEECLQAAEDIRNDKKASEKLALNFKQTKDTFGVYGVYNEMMLYAKYKGVNIRGIIDNLTIDVIKKEVNINDLKTTSMTLDEFKEAVQKWKYWLQGVFYKKLVKEFIATFIPKEELDQWNININFVVRDRQSQVYVFPVSEESLKEWEEQAEKEFDDALWHLENKSFNLPRKYEEGLIKL